MNTRLGIALGAAAFGAGPALGGVIQYTAQTRTVSAEATEGDFPHDGDTDSGSAPGFGAWDGHASANYGFLDHSVSPPVYTSRATGSASQSVTLGADRISAASINASASAFGDPPTASSNMLGSGRAEVTVTFTLAEATEFRLDGSASGYLAGPGISNWFVDFVLDGDNGFGFDRSIASANNDPGGAFASHGELEAGTWTLTIVAQALAGSIPQDPSTEATAASIFVGFELVIPAPGTAGVLGLAGVLAARRRRG